MEEEVAATGSTGVFTTGTISLAEPVMRQIGYNLSRQSDRSLPRTYFRSGYIPNKSRKDNSRSALKRSGQEVPGIVLVVLIFLLMTEEPSIQRILKSIGSHRIQHWIKLLETLLLFESWLKSESINRADADLVGSEFVPWFVDFFKRVVRRVTGEGLDIPKVHLNFHIWKDILRLGVPINYTGHFAESNLKFNAKNWGKLTQMRSHSIDSQTAERSYEASVIRLAKAEVDYLNTGHIGFFFGPSEKTKPITNKERKGLSIVCIFSNKHTDDGDLRLQASFSTRKRDKHDFAPGIRVQARWTSTELSFEGFSTCATSLLAPLATENTIHFYTEFRAHESIYRANPLQKDRPWQDFAMVSSTVGGKLHKIPVQLLVFFRTDVNSKEGDRAIPCLTDHGDIKPGEYALVHYFDEDPFCPERQNSVYGNSDSDYKIDGNCSLVRWQCKSTEAIGTASLPQRNQRHAKRYIPRLALVSLAQVVEPCIAIPDRNSAYPHLWMFVMPRRLWADAFLTLVNGEMREDLQARKENTQDASSEDSNDWDLEEDNDESLSDHGGYESELSE